MGRSANTSQAGSEVDRGVSGRSTWAVAICAVINMIDGADVLAMAFTAPAVAREWALDQEQVGFLLSSGLVGLTVGAFFLSPLADGLGRRPAILIGLTITCAGMFGSYWVLSFGGLVILRILTGLGVGGMSTTIGIMAVENASPERKRLAVGVIAIGFPLGAMIGGTLAAAILPDQGWRAIFILSGAATLAMLSVTFFCLQESPEFLNAGPSPPSPDRGSRLGTSDMTNPPRTNGDPVSGARPFRRERLVPTASFLATTVVIGATYFSYMMSYGFITNWAPKLMTDLGHSDRHGISTSALISFGGIFGGLGVGLLNRAFPTRALTFTLLIAVSALIALFGWSGANLGERPLGIISIMLGFAIFGGAVGIYSTMVQFYPVRSRATGGGIGFGCGRLGGAIGTYFGGVLLAYPFNSTSVCMMLAFPALLAAVLSLAMPATRAVDLRTAKEPPGRR